MTTSSSMMSPETLRSSLTLFEVKPGMQYSEQVLKNLLPDVETALFFGKVFNLDHVQLSRLLALVVSTPLAEALFGGTDQHSVDLQDYVVDVCRQARLEMGDTKFGQAPPKGEILPAMWELMQVEVAQSIKDVAAKLESVVGLLPGKQGSMVFSSMLKMNARRPTLGDYKARIEHAPLKENLVILDVSGSMNARTVETIISDVVALSYNANAHMATVSTECHYWAPGSYGVDEILAKAAYGGTHYEQLAPLFDRDWGTVVTIADYDSSYGAMEHIGNVCVGSVDSLLDISLVNRPTFMAEVVGQLASEVRPLLIANSSRVLRN